MSDVVLSLHNIIFVVLGDDDDMRASILKHLDNIIIIRVIYVVICRCALKISNIPQRLHKKPHREKANSNLANIVIYNNCNK